ncbi:hypothetical protein RhiirA4_461009, partial [Rhizophagus irregularis]
VKTDENTRKYLDLQAIIIDVNYCLSELYKLKLDKSALLSVIIVVEDMTKSQDRRDLPPSINSQYENKLALRASSATEIKTEHGGKDDDTDLPADFPLDQKDLRYLPRNSILSRT